MNKNQYIEKYREIVRKAINHGTLPIPNRFGEYVHITDHNRVVREMEAILSSLDSVVSECWDMAEEDLIEKVDLEIEAWMGANQNLDREFTTHEMMKHLRNTILTSQKEGKTE